MKKIIVVAILSLTTGCAALYERRPDQGRYDYWSTTDSHMAGLYDRYYIGTAFDYWIVSGDSTTVGVILCLLDMPFTLVLDTALLPLDFTLTVLDKSGSVEEKTPDPQPRPCADRNCVNPGLTLGV